MQVRPLLLIFCCTILFSALPVYSQTTPHYVPPDARLEEHVPNNPTPGKKEVERAFQFQRRLMHGLETIDTVAKNWARTAKLPSVKADRDALAISYGCEGLMEIERDSLARADSLLTKSMPLFKYKDSKSYFLVALAQLQSKRSHYAESFERYAEILGGFDSLDALKDITFYSESGYAPYAYGIDAALHLANIGLSIPEYRTPAVALLLSAYDRHEIDALGLMALTGLKHLDTARARDYDFLIEKLCSRKPELRKTADKFEAQFSALKKE